MKEQKVSRVMHVNPEGEQSGKLWSRWQRDGRPDKEAAYAISSCFCYYARLYTPSKRRNAPLETMKAVMDLHWAFWKPFLAWAMVLRLEKKFLLDQLLQILVRLGDERPPPQVERNFYKNLVGLEVAWNTFEFYAPLLPPPCTRRTASVQYKTLREHWPLPDRVTKATAALVESLPFNTFPSFPINGDYHCHPSPSPATTDPQSSQFDLTNGYAMMTRSNWRNLNDFLARLYTIKCKSQCTIDGLINPVRDAGWWLWKGLYALIETLETMPMPQPHQDTARAIATLWLTHHGLRLRQADFVDGIKRHINCNFGELAMSGLFTSITCARAPNAVGGLNHMPVEFWYNVMPRRWDLWWNNLDQLQARVPPEDSQDATVSTKLIHNLHVKLSATCVNFYTNELASRKDPELEDMFKNKSWETDDKIFVWQGESVQAFVKEKAKSDQHPNAAAMTPDELQEQIRRRLYRIDSEQRIMYPVFERNAIQREFTLEVNGTWQYRPDAWILAARKHTSYVLAWNGWDVSFAPTMVAQYLGEEYHPGDTVGDVESRYMESRVEEFRCAMREPKMWVDWEKRGMGGYWGQDDPVGAAGHGHRYDH
jgi:hypothetical protein